MSARTRTRPGGDPGGRSRRARRRGPGRPPGGGDSGGGSGRRLRRRARRHSGGRLRAPQFVRVELRLELVDRAAPRPAIPPGQRRRSPSAGIRARVPARATAATTRLRLLATRLLLRPLRVLPRLMRLLVAVRLLRLVMVRPTAATAARLRPWQLGLRSPPARPTRGSVRVLVEPARRASTWTATTPAWWTTSTASSSACTSRRAATTSRCKLDGYTHATDARLRGRRRDHQAALRDAARQRRGASRTCSGGARRAEREVRREREREDDETSALPASRRRASTWASCGCDVAPADASIYVDGAFRGTGREAGALRLRPGGHRIEVVRPGYRTADQEIEVARARRRSSA